MVAHALNEGIVLEADAAAVRKQSLPELCSHINSCIAVVSADFELLFAVDDNVILTVDSLEFQLNANYQGLRLIAESGAEADLELKQVKDAL
ncbi:hypothetical protein FRX31_006389, partial [Thalictrum thalictroides]